MGMKKETYMLNKRIYRFSISFRMSCPLICATFFSFFEVIRFFGFILKFRYVFSILLIIYTGLKGTPSVF